MSETGKDREIARLKRDLLEAQANVEIEQLHLTSAQEELRRMRDRAEKAEGLVKRQAEELHAQRVRIEEFDAALRRVFERAGIECVACAEACFTGGAWTEHRCDLAQAIGEALAS